MLDLFKKAFDKKFFFTNYAKAVTNWRQKCVGKNSNGNSLDFTEADKTTIQAGLKKLFDDLQG